MPYFTAADIPEPSCERSLNDLGWEGAWEDASRPRLITCPLCGARLWADFEQYIEGPKKGLFYASVPGHYPGENSVLLPDDE